MTQDELKSRLHYDPETGVFTWLDNPDAPLRWRNRYVGKQAGTINASGYVVIYLNNKQHYAHRLAFLYVYGYIPKEVDHISGEKSKNRISNLRDVSHADNGRNLKQCKRNLSGVTGVSRDEERGKWLAQIMYEGRAIFGGRFEEFNDAVKSRKQLEEKYGFHKNHGRKSPSEEGQNSF